MKKQISFLVIFFVLISFSVAQSYPYDYGNYHTWDSYSIPNKSIYNSWDGNGLEPNGQYRVLSIFVNIIYDIPGVADPFPPDNNEHWDPATTEGINNQSIPDYLLDFADTSYSNPNNVHGTFTKLYYESSFGSLIFLSDFIVVNIKHSTIIATHPTDSTFNLNELMSKVAIFINLNGGINTIYQHNTINDYDQNSDSIIDLVAFFIRNSKAYFGTCNAGSGHAGLPCPNFFIDTTSYEVQGGVNTYQCIGNTDQLVTKPINIFSHETGHLFFGGNNFHTSGGNHYSTYTSSPFMGLQGGYGLMGCYNSGLQCTNGYERWRMHWRDTSNQNSNDWWIVARDTNNINNIHNGDIQQSDGNQSFILRDFVTYGDAIRIKLPYKDDNAYNQYIWIENHQVGNNGKLDFLAHSNTTPCRNEGTPGIYAYYQIGRDVLSSTESGDVWDNDNTDNLKIISAEGNWDFEKIVPDDTLYCVGWNIPARTEQMANPNPFNGYQDQQMHIFPKNIVPYNTLTLDDCNYNAIKYNHNGQGPIQNLSYMGDNLDAFTNNTELSLGTNPAPVNAITSYCNQHNTNIFIQTLSTLNNRTTYLTGLSVKFYDKFDGTFKVVVRWDDYDVRNDVIWTGNIDLKEQVNLLSNKTIVLVQNNTPNQIAIDSISGKFAPTTVFTCKTGSMFHQQYSSNVIVDNKSSLVINQGATYIIDDSSELVVKNGCSLYIDNCAALIINGSGKLTIESGATIYISDGAILDFENGQENLDLISGYIVPTGYINPIDKLPPHTNITSSNEIWTNENYTARNITVSPGAKLTINTSTISFLYSSSKTVIDASGTLTLNNATLSSVNTCDQNFWQGIELRGDGNESQLTQGAQGEVEIINGGTIENALCGIYVGERDGNGNLLPGTGGGIVKATGGVFKNCVEAVHYTPYKNFNPNDQNHPEIINTGYFTDCTFETDDDFYSMTVVLPKSFMTLNGIKGLRLKGNTFQNTADDVIPAQERGKGITSVDAMYYLYPGCLNQTAPCTLPDPNVFEKLHYGIYAANIKPLIPIYVKDNDFTDNFRAIRITGMEGAVITGNTFDIGANLGPISPYSFGIDAYGIHLEGCSGYQVQDNTFETDDDGRYGIIITNSGPKANLLNNNTFSGLLIACQAEGVNGSMPYCGTNVGNINTGLIFKCNEYSDNTVTDISVTSGTIDVEQGLCTDTYSPAGNTFANHGTLGNLWANSWVTPYRYNYHGAEVTTPYVINPIAAVHSCDISYSSQSCALPYGNYTIQELQQIINTNVTALSGMKRKIDGGNTQNVLDYIDTKPDGEDLRYLLAEQMAPYVSDEVLIKTIFYHDTISDAQLADVIVANSPVTENVMDFLNKINLDGNSREIIINAQTGISARFLLEDSINNAQTALDYASNELVSIYLSDTTLTGAKNIAEIYNEANDTTNYLKIIAAEAYMVVGETDNAQNVLDAIESDDPEITNSVEYLSILCDTNNVWDTVVNLTTAQLQSLENIALSGTRVAYNAKTLLEIALDTIYDEVIESIEIADSLTISGHLHENSNCSNNAVAGDTLLIKSPQGMIYTKVSPVVTDSNGYFKFNPMELSLINDTVEFTISTKNSFSVDAAGTGTRADWIGQSPLHLTLEKLYRSWKYDFENVQEMMTVSKSVALADQVYVAGSIYNPSTENTDAVLLKLDTAGNMLWNVYYDGEGGDNKVMDFYVDDSLKIYLLLFTEVENEPLTEIVVYDSSGNEKWKTTIDNIRYGKFISGNNDGYIYVGGDNSVSDNQYCYVYRYTETGSVDWYTSFEESNTPFEFVALAMLNDTTILSACVDLYSNTTYVYASKTCDGTPVNGLNLSDFKAVDLLSDDGSIYLSGNGALGGLVLTQKINAGYEIEWSAGEESDLIYTTPGCLTKDTKGNISVLYYDNVGFGITSYDADGYENWSVSESGDWYSEIEKLSLKTDEEGNLYTLLASNNFEQGGLRSYIYKHNTSGEKQWEQFFEYTRLYDFALSENGNIYTSGSLFFAENEYSLSIYKYAQCYITANLRSAADSTNIENLSETYVKLYPNPNDGTMQLEYLLPENLTGTFELYDLTGRKVYSLALQESSGLKSISAHNLTRGVYMYRVVSGDKTVDMGKVVVIK